ncbi:hypothetical protein [Mycobacterium sp. HUMS_1102779]|uniref:hypothetical protein n=1 Tax=Mycobacterium sp. HUMS_1102779 TaxID=3383487 RepID=UPI003899FBBD
MSATARRSAPGVCWNQRAAEDYPLRAVMAHADLLIDLAGSAPDTAAPGRTLRLPRERFDYGALVLPGLLAALCGRNGVRLTIDVLVACARALAAITPTGQIVPALTESLLVPTVDAEVARALGEHRSPRRPIRHADAAPHRPMAQHQHCVGESL